MTLITCQPWIPAGVLDSLRGDPGFCDREQRPGEEPGTTGSWRRDSWFLSCRTYLTPHPTPTYRNGLYSLAFPEAKIMEPNKPTQGRTEWDLWVEKQRGCGTSFHSAAGGPSHLRCYKSPSYVGQRRVLGAGSLGVELLILSHL